MHLRQTQTLHSNLKFHKGRLQKTQRRAEPNDQVAGISVRIRTLLGIGAGELDQIRQIVDHYFQIII